MSTLEPGVECCIYCDSTERLEQCRFCKFKYCYEHFLWSVKGICHKCIQFKMTKHPKCWSCNKTVPKEQLHPRSGNSVFSWRCYGFTFDCEECIYWWGREPKCPDCKGETDRQIRYKDKITGEYIDNKKPKFWCPKCKKMWRIKEKPWEEQPHVKKFKQEISDIISGMHRFREEFKGF